MCGVFGVWGHPEAANITYLGLHALQHRGQDSAGISSTDHERLYAQRVTGLVQAGFSTKELAELKGDAAIGHVRYATAGTAQLSNAQPIAVDYADGSIALGHNGNLTNHDALRAELEAEGSIFQSGTDTETIVHLFARSNKVGVEDRLIDALGKVQGAYSLLLLSEKKMIAVRDPMGIRPLVLGKMKRGDNELTVVASEPTSFDLIGADMVRDVKPGEVLVIDDDGVRSFFPFESRERAMCLFEYVYFARPDANLEGASVYEVRKELGRRLAEEHPLPTLTPQPPLPEGRGGDSVVVPVPDSGVPAAIGFAEASGIPFQMGLIRSHYVGRTFIEPQDSIRHFGVRLKLNPNRAVLEGKRVIVVDDSVVRGTTSRKIVKMVRDAGAKEVHVRVSSPPTKWPCFYGIATPTREELIASSQSTEEIARFLEADSVGYLTLPALIGACDAVQGNPSRQAKYCHACFSGDYPVPIPKAPTHRLRLVG